MITMRRRMGTRVPAAECVMGWHLVSIPDFVRLMEAMWREPSARRRAIAKRANTAKRNRRGGGRGA